MYEKFGARVTGSTVEFQLFFPDTDRDPTQYSRGGLPHISTLRVVGSFQGQLGQAAWERTTAPMMVRQPHANGWLYTCTLPELPDGYYEYKYFAEFENGTTRWCGDPCTKYGASAQENSAFVIGGNDLSPRRLAKRLPLKDLVIYELMLDDFTAEYRGARAPLDAVHDKIPHLVDLGINAIEFMPWTAWSGGGFSWGYNPFAFFSVEHSYYDDPTVPVDKLYRLQRLIDELHTRGIHVIMDGVFNHVEVGTDPGRGFPYYWLYQDPADSPYIGSFEQAGYFEEFDYANTCTAQFITDVCCYWLEEFKVDGIRFDYALGFDRRSERPQGLARVLDGIDLWTDENSTGEHVSLTLELLTDNRYEAIGRTNQLRATGCWYDQLMWELFETGRTGHANTRLMRALDSGRDFDSSRRPVTYIENHDHSTVTEQCGGRAAWWRTQPLAVALMCISGAPLIHNGQEWGEQYWFPEQGDGRVEPRQLRWTQLSDNIGQSLMSLYRRLIAIRHQYPALRSQNFYPVAYDERTTQFNAYGYGIDEQRDVAIIHRWGNDEQGGLERLIIVLNFSAYDQTVNIPFSANGQWEDLLNGGTARVDNFYLLDQAIGSHWARVYLQRA